ncbi:hypothetical protein CDAR_444731 [Caerostris darwini]|uniref:Bro-N domain-containing protein n=1 Tax=Caerostris darwini TaxID=1538125 RepID=A0AAV4W604_9ARAC|nr:hypothetical protein CDAR_444731 [Caerostris darwini]
MALHHFSFLYDSEQHDITYIKDKDGSPWFKADDIDEVLEYRHFLSADYQKEWHEIGDSGNEDPYTLFVNTRGLLKWLSSTIDTPEKEAFKRWIVNEPLPTIRGPHILQVYKKKKKK